MHTAFAMNSRYSTILLTRCLALVLLLSTDAKMLFEKS